MSLEEVDNLLVVSAISNPGIQFPKQTDWVRTPIDAFILAKLEEQALTPAPPADKRTLISPCKRLI